MPDTLLCWHLCIETHSSKSSLLVLPTREHLSGFRKISLKRLGTMIRIIFESKNQSFACNARQIFFYFEVYLCRSVNLFCFFDLYNIFSGKKGYFLRKYTLFCQIFLILLNNMSSITYCPKLLYQEKTVIRLWIMCHNLINIMYLLISINVVWFFLCRIRIKVFFG